MTGQPPPDPRSSRSRNLGFDEFIAILVAFLAIGAILFWGLTRRGTDFRITAGDLFSDAPETTPINELEADPNLPFVAGSPEAEVPLERTTPEAIEQPATMLLNPNQPVIRAEVTAMIYQVLEATRQVEPIQSGYIVQP